MTNQEAINWLINVTSDIGKAEHRDLWHYEQALSEIKEMLETSQPEIIRCKDCRKHNVDTGWKSDCCPLVYWRGKAQGHEFDYQHCAYGERREE